MKTGTGCTLHKGFSLIELLVVILIVSVVYFLGFGEFGFTKAKPKPLTPMNLKAEILKSKMYESEATLICLDKCRTCYLRSKFSSAFQPYPNALDLKELKVYALDESDALVRIEYGRYQDQDICLMIDFNHNGSSTQVILENQNGAYFLPSFFGKTLRFNSPEEAREYWLKKSYSLSDSGAFY